MRTVLVEASPRDPSTGAVVPVRLAGLGSQPYMWLGFTDWRSGIMDIPRFTASLEFGDAGWTGGAVPQVAALNFMSADRLLVSDLANLYWKDAPLTVRVGDDEAPAPTFPVLLSATVAAASGSDGLLTLTIADLSEKLNKPLAPTYFAGTGGVEGHVSAKGRFKRRTFGFALNIEGRILDPANLIYEFGDTAKPLTEIRTVRDRGRDGPITILAWQGSADATLTALKAATPVQGGGVVAPSIACVKWWTTAAGPLTADIGGEYYEGVAGTAPHIANLLAGFAGLSVSNLAQAQAARSAAVGLHCDSDTETIASAIDRLLIGSSLLWVLDPDGTIRLEEWSLDTSLHSLAWSQTANAPIAWSPGGAPPIAWVNAEQGVEEIVSQGVSRATFFAPIKSRKLGYQTNNRVMNDGEIAQSILTPTFRGPEAPPNPQVGDLWIDTDDGDKLYRWDGAAWIVSQDSGAIAGRNGLNTDGTVKPNKVATDAIVAGAVTVPAALTSADTSIPAGGAVTIETTDWIDVGDTTDGGGIVQAYGEVDGGTTVDIGARINLYLDTDNGAGFVKAATGAAGSRTNGGGDTYMRGLIMASSSVANVSRIRIMTEVVSEAMPGGSAKAFLFRSPQIVIMGGKR